MRNKKKTILAMEHVGGLAVSNGTALRAVPHGIELTADVNGLFQTLIEAIPDAIYFKDTKGRIVVVNKAFEKLVGQSRLKIVGRTEWELFSTDLAELREKSDEEVLRSGKLLRFEERIVDSNAEQRFFETVKAPVFGDHGDLVGLVGTSRDITQQKKEREELAEAKAHSEKLFDLLADPVVTVDETGKILDITSKVKDMTGFEREEVLGKSFLGLGALPDKSEKTALENLQRRLKGEDVPPYEVEVVTKNGAKRRAEVKAVRIECKGKPAIMAMLYDITKRKRIEEDLTRERDLLQALMDNIPDAIYFKDAESRFTRTNKAHAQMIGSTDPKAAIGKTDFDFYAEEFAREAYADEQEIVRTAEPLVNKIERIRRPDGFSQWVSATKVPIRDEKGHVTGLVGITRDITVQKLLEQELAHERDLLYALMDNIPDNIYFKDAESRFVRINRAHAQRLGLRDPEEAVGKTVSDFYSEEYSREAHADEREIFRTGKPLVGKTVRIKTPDGRFRWVSTTKVPIKDKDGHVTGIAGVSRDITEDKKMEDKLRRYSEHLEDLVEEKTRKLREAERMAAIGETAAMVGHDLRNPLQVMVYALYLLRKKLELLPSPSSGGENLKELCGRMDEQVAYMNKIVSDLQDFSGPLKPEMVDTNLSQLVEKTLSAVSIPSDVKVSVVIPGDFPKLRVDPGMMRRVFTNLIMNALQAMPEGGQLVIKASRTDKAALVSVEDTGAGMSEGDLPNLFKPLFSTKARGQGLGLAVCNRLVKAHRGVIRAKSKVGRGSTFTVRIPLEPDID